MLHFEGDSATPYAGSYERFVLQRTERRLTQLRMEEQALKAFAKQIKAMEKQLGNPKNFKP